MSITGDLVTLRGGTAARVYALGSVPATPTYPYVVIGYAPTAPTVRRLSGSGDPTKRFTVQHFGKTADSVEASASITFTTFEGREVSGAVCWHETATPLYPTSRGVLNVLHTYRY